MKWNPVWGQVTLAVALAAYNVYYESVPINFS